MPLDVSFAVQSHPQVGKSFASFAREVEDLGFDALVVPDHPGSTAAPFVALASVAEATHRIRLGTTVVNAGAWTALALASEVATLDVVSDGRALFGIGAGHTPAEWTMSGRDYPSPSGRVSDMIELVDAVRRLLDGETVTVEGGHVRLREAKLAWPPTPRDAVPLLVGGNGRRLVRYGATVADAVELTGLGRTLPDGHRHVPEWTEAAVTERVALVRGALGSAGRRLRLGALVQLIEVTEDRRGAAEEFGRRLGEGGPEAGAPRADDLLSSPFVMIGTVEEITEQVVQQHQKWGFDRYTVRPDGMATVAAVMERLRR